MMKKLIAALFALLVGAPAYGQSVQQSGTVTAKHLPYWVAPGVIGDAGTSASSPISSIGITNNNGCALGINSAATTSGAWNQLCFGVSTTGAATITLQNFGTASPQVLDFIINGTTFPFPGALASLIVGNTPVQNSINGECLTVASGILAQVPCTILSAGTTGTGPVVLQNSPILVGTIGGNLTFGGNESFPGNVVMGSQLVVNGVSTPASAANQTVVMGNISAPTLLNTGQAWLFNQSVAGATLQGDGSNFDITLINKNGGVVAQIPTGTTGVTFPGVLTFSGLSSGTCAASVLLNSANQTITGSCPGAASSIQVGTTAVVSGTTGNILFNNAGTLGNETIASILIAGTGIAITGTTNATVALGGTSTAHGVAVWEGSGANLGNTGTGTVGQAFIGNGGSADPSFKSGPWTLLNTLVASTSAALSDTTSFTSAYNEYELVFENIVPASSSVECVIQVHSGGAFQTTGYLGQEMHGSATAVAASASTLFIPCSAGSSVISTVAGVSARFTIYQPSQSNAPKNWTGNYSHPVTGPATSVGSIAGFWNANGVIDGFQTLFTAGNITSGIVKVYGRL